MSHRPHILALATSVVALAAALKSIRSPGTEGYASAQHAEDLVTNVLAELNDIPVGDLQADARTTMTTNPHTIEPQAADLADKVLDDKIDPDLEAARIPKDNTGTVSTTEPVDPASTDKRTAEEVKADAAKSAVAVDKAPGADVETKSGDGKPANATGAVGTKTAG